MVAEFSVNIIIVLGSERVGSEMQKRFAGQTTSVGDTITVVGLDKSGGIMERDEAFMQSVRESAIREYFFGNAKMTLSPFTQHADFVAVSIWRINEGKRIYSCIPLILCGQRFVYLRNCLDSATIPVERFSKIITNKPLLKRPLQHMQTAAALHTTKARHAQTYSRRQSHQ